MATPEPGFPIRLFSLEEANEQLPRVRGLLARLRAARKAVFGAQALAEVEELAGGDGTRLAGLLAQVEAGTADFHAAAEELHALGCELKDLDRGLVDFRSVRGNEVVYLCWMEGEPGIVWWHPLNSGVKGRSPL